MRSLRGLVAVAFLLMASAASAQSPNRYGEQGRTVLQGGLGASVHGSGFTQSREAWRTSANVTLVHFVQENFAIGGTLTADVTRLRDSGLANEPIGSEAGGDIDMIGYIPASRHLGLRIWGWVGVRHARRPRLQLNSQYPGYYYDDPQITTETNMHAVLGISPDVLVLLSPSVALAFGPRLALYLPFSAGADFDWSLTFGPAVSYSFGAPPKREGEAAGKPVVPRFASRGRNVLMGGVAIGSSMGGSIGYARFVSDHIAIGPHVLGGARAEDNLTPYWLGAGVQMIAELPLRGRWSVLFMPEVAYRYDRMSGYNPPYYYSTPYSGYVPSGPFARFVTTHEVQLEGSILPVFHLFEAVVLGAGPTITEHIRVASSSDVLDRAYLSLGITSLLAGSF